MLQSVSAQPLISLPAQTTTLQIDSHVEYAQLPQNTQFVYLEEFTAPQQVAFLNRLGQFRRVGPRGLNFGAANDNFLFRFRVRRSANEVDSWLLTLLNPEFCFAACYVVTANKQVVVMKTDSYRKTGDAYLYGSCTAWPIALPDTLPVTVYLLCLGGSVPKHYPLEIMTTGAFQQTTARHSLFWGGYFGLMLALLLYNLIVFWSVRDRSYLFYCLLLMAHIFFQLKSSGYGGRYVWWDLPLFSPHAPVLIAGFTLFAGLSFTVLFLDTHRFVPRLHKPMVVLAAQSLVLCVLLTSVGISLPENYCIVGYFGLVAVGAGAGLRWAGHWLRVGRPYLTTLIWFCGVNLVLVWLGEVLGPFSSLGIISAGAALVLCTWVGLAARRNGNPNAGFYLVAWTSLLLAVAVYVVYMTGVLPYHFLLANVLSFGSAGEALLLALANRINGIRRDREQTLLDLVNQLTINQQQQQRLQTIRNDIARDLHDDIGSSLSSIGILSQTAHQLTRTEPARAQLLLNRVVETSQQVMEAMNDLVWNVNPAHDNLEQVLERMQDFGNELFADTATTFVFDTTIVSQLVLPVADRRRNLFLIYKEALINSVKYAAANRVVVTLRHNLQTLTLEIADDGRGFDPANATHNRLGENGLTNMKNRAAQIGAHVQIESAPGLGTRVSLHIPV